MGHRVCEKGTDCLASLVSQESKQASKQLHVHHSHSLRHAVVDQVRAPEPDTFVRLLACHMP